MGIVDLLRIAAKNLKGRWAVLPIAGIAIGVFCLGFAGAVQTAVQTEKSAPYELGVTAGSADLDDSAVAEVAALDDVTAATAVLQVPVTINTGEYQAELVLTGVDGAYLTDGFLQGGLFPDSGVMPYIVLNAAACDAFVSKETETAVMNTDTDMTKVDWVSASASVQMGEGMRPVVAKIAGVLDDGDDEDDMAEPTPAAYISIACAKDLLRESRLSADYMAASVRVTNIGYADSVAKCIGALGLAVTNDNGELQSRWDGQIKEMTYLIVVGGFCLLCAAVLMTAWRRISLLEQKDAFAALQWIGLRDRDIGWILVLQALMMAAFGIAIGILVCAVLPSFLPPELQGASIFTLPLPAGAALIGALIGLIIGMAPLIGIRKAVAASGCTPR